MLTATIEPDMYIYMHIQIYIYIYIAWKPWKLRKMLQFAALFLLQSYEVE